VILRSFYATKSKDKNRAFREASQGEGKLLVKTMLDPLNNEFVSAVEKNREGKINPDVVLTGHTYVGKDAVQNGLIDGIRSLDQVLKQLSNKNKNQSQFNMKEFKHVLAAAQVDSVYEENTFFGLNEDQTFAVEQTMQANDETITALQNDKATLGVQVSTLQDEVNTANENFANACAEIENLKGENERLKNADGTNGADVSKDKDEKTKTLPKTTVDQWWEDLNK